MPDAIEMLREDHRKVKELFEQFERSGDSDGKEQVAHKTLQELELHAALEEEIFYPAAREHVHDEEQIHEALEEHHVAKLLIGELKKMSPDDERYEAKYKVLAESVKHHIQEEESEMFPMLEDRLDADGLGAQMEERKQKLQQRMTSRAGARRSKTKARAKTGSKRGRPRQTARKGRKRASGGRR
ncbi:MAG TPA: hemerythrin domain-containing protein [Candidatus Binatia bacterium]|nr:hemerythrin domain-containing protein [Candidatus Binatia bacterium]